MKINIILDFDGVVINSHKIKTKAFYNVFNIYGEKIADKSKRFHLKNIGKNRYFKFKFIFKKYIKKKFSLKIKKELDEKFDSFVLKKIDKLQISKYLLKLLKLNEKYNFYISTSTPTNKIVSILKRKKIHSYFYKIYGSPEKKYNHIKLIKKNKNPTIFIGDSIEDYKASKKSNIEFILKNNSENLTFRNKYKNLYKINSFKNLDKKISKILK